MGRAKVSDNPERIKKAFKDCYGIVTDTAKKLRISRETLRQYMLENPELRQAQIDARQNEFKDLIEGALVKNIKAGKEASIIFASKCQLQDRGYKERLEITDKSKIEDQLDDASDEELLQIIADANRRINDAS